MAIKKRAKKNPSAEDLANELADKPYGDAATLSISKNELTRVSVSLPVYMQEKLEDMALENKRSGAELKSTSAIIRAAVDEYFKKY